MKSPLEFQIKNDERNKLKWDQLKIEALTCLALVLEVLNIDIIQLIQMLLFIGVSWRWKQVYKHLNHNLICLLNIC